MSGSVIQTEKDPIRNHGDVVGDGIGRLSSQASICEKSEYDVFVDTSPQGILYQHTWWLDVVAPDSYEILMYREGGRIRAAWPLTYADSRRVGSIVNPQLSQQLGILFAPSKAKYTVQLSAEMRMMEALLDGIPQGVGLRQNFHYAFTNWLPFLWRGYSQRTRYTYVIEDLTDLEATWLNMQGDVRTKIRKSQKQGIVEKQTNDVELFYSINKMTFERQGRSIPYDLDRVARIAEISRPGGGMSNDDRRGWSRPTTRVLSSGL